MDIVLSSLIRFRDLTDSQVANAPTANAAGVTSLYIRIGWLRGKGVEVARTRGARVTSAQLAKRRRSTDHGKNNGEIELGLSDFV